MSELVYKKYGFSRGMGKAITFQLDINDLANWTARESWTYVETACLFKNIDPFFIKADGYGGWQHPADYEQNIKPIADILKTWFTDSHPFFWLDKAIEKNISIFDGLLNAAKVLFLKNHSRNNDIAKKFPFLAETTEIKPISNNIQIAESQTLIEDPDQELIERIKTETVSERDKRVKDRGYEIYGIHYKVSPHKKIKKEDVVKQIFDEETKLYIKADKKQPDIGTYMKAARRKINKIQR